jgi:hypothetical protein
MSACKTLFMRNRLLPVAISFLMAALVTLLFQSCFKDKCTSRYTFWEPVYMTKAEVRANVKNNPSREIERPGKIYIRGNYIFLNELDKGIHIIDNSNPSAPRNIAFVNIPGNLDMAVKGNMLYADMYSDLVAINITDPLHVATTKFVENIFPERRWNNGFSQNPNMVITDWVRKDTVVPTTCGGSSGMFGGLEKRTDILFFSAAQTGSGTAGGGGAASSPFGVGGSMARFTIVNDHMYAVMPNSLNVVSISNAADPVFNRRVTIGFGIETIYPFNNRLFIGSTAGMFVYDIANPTNPVQLSSFQHVRSCDPVIADNTYAYVTLRSGNTCQGFTNQLDIVDITNITSPVLKKTYQLTNPHGLSKDGTTLIICDGKDGLKFYNSADINNLQLLKTIKTSETYDVIAFNKWALVVASDGLYQYDYSDLNNIRQLSKLSVK